MILSIDTATDEASVSLSKDGSVIGTMENNSQKDHAAWIQVAVNTLLQKHGYAIQQLQAVAVTAGPGSYTGLRGGHGNGQRVMFCLTNTTHNN